MKRYNKDFAYSLILSWTNKNTTKRQAAEQFNEILEFSHRHEVAFKLGILMTGRTWRRWL